MSIGYIYANTLRKELAHPGTDPPTDTEKQLSILTLFTRAFEGSRTQRSAFCLTPMQ